MVVLHHGEIPLKRLQPRIGRRIGIALLDAGELLVGAAEGAETGAEFRVWLEVVSVTGHDTTQELRRQSLLLVFVAVGPAGEPLDVGGH